MQKETIAQPRGVLLAPPGGDVTTWDTSLSSMGTKSPTQVEDGNFKLSTRWLEPECQWLRFLEHHLSPHHQPIRGRLHTLQPSPPLRYLYKLPPWIPFRSSDLLSMTHLFSLHGPCHQSFPAPNWPSGVFGLAALWAPTLALGDNKRLDRRVRGTEGILKTEADSGVMWGYKPKNVGGKGKEMDIF